MDTIYIKQCDCPEIQGIWMPAMGDWVVVRKKVEWDGYVLCVDVGEVTVVLGIDKRGYSGNPIVGDVEDIAFYPECSWKGFDDTPKENLIWLPTQSQLQKMVTVSHKEDYNNSMYPILEKLYTFACSMYTNTSMEQLGLAFVMHELHKKIWANGKWEIERP